MVKPVLFTVIFFCSALVAKEGRITVKVLDKQNNLPVNGATMTINDSTTGESNSDGIIRFTDITPGIYAATAVSEGYDTLFIPTLHIKSGTNDARTLLLRSNSTLSLDDMTVTGISMDNSMLSKPASVTRISNYELTNTPGSLDDINRVVSNLPSAVSGLGGDLGNTLNIRGGHSRESIYLVDGIEFDNINHFSDLSSSGGVVGFINASQVDHLDFYTGSFSSSFPSALSSVMDIKLREGSFSKRKQQIDLAITGIGITTEGPFSSTGRSSYLLNSRIVYPFLVSPFLEEGMSVTYGDALGKFTFLLNDNNTLSTHGIFSFDRADDPAVEWYGSSLYDQNVTQAAGNVTWEMEQGRISNKVQLNHLYSLTDDFNFLTSDPIPNEGAYNYTMEYEREDSIPQLGDTLVTYETQIDDTLLYTSFNRRNSTTIQNDFTLNCREEDQFRLGVYAKLHTLKLKETNFGTSVHYELSELIDTAQSIDTLLFDTSFYNQGMLKDTSVQYGQTGGYAEYELKAGPLTVTTGVRGDYYRLVRDHGFSPRTSLLYSMGSAGTMTLSGGLYYQLPTMINDAILMLTPDKNNPNSIPFPTFQDIELQRSGQVTLGYRNELGKEHLITAEGYFKYYDREYEMDYPNHYRFWNDMNSGYHNGTAFKLADPRGRKRSYGAELLFQKKRYDKFYYSAGYAWMESENRYTDKKWYRDQRNVRHSFVGIVGANFLTHHGVALKARVRSGLPYSEVTYNEQDYLWDYANDNYYSQELPAVVTLDFRYSFRLYRNWGNITGYVDLLNITNQTPVIQKEFNPWLGYQEIRSNGFLPVVGVKVDF